MLIAQIDREPIKLQLRNILNGKIKFRAKKTTDSIVKSKSGAVVAICLGFNRQHRYNVTYRGELLNRSTTNAVSRRVRSREFWEFSLNSLQFAE